MIIGLKTSTYRSFQRYVLSIELPATHTIMERVAKIFVGHVMIILDIIAAHHWVKEFVMLAGLAITAANLNAYLVVMKNMDIAQCQTSANVKPVGKVLCVTNARNIQVVCMALA